MKRLRSFLTAFCFIGFGLGGFIIGAVLFPILYIFIPSRCRRTVYTNIVHFSWKFFVWIMSILLLIRVTTQNKKILKDLKGTIVVANHPTLLDIVILISLIPRSICLVKDKLAKNILLRPLIKSIYLLNDVSPEEFLVNGKKALNEGLNVIIFPEGTRTDNCKPERRIHRGFAQLAIFAKKDVVLVKIKSTPKILGKKQKWYDVGNKTTNYSISMLGKISPISEKNASNHALSKKYVSKITPIFN